MTRLLSSLPLLQTCLLLLVCSSLLFWPTSAQPGQPWTLYNFCYWTQNTLATSPHLAWGMQMSGTLNLTTLVPYLGVNGYLNNYGEFGGQIAYGYPVTAATGQRVVYQQGNGPKTSTITGVAPVLTYNGNDNILSVSGIYLDNTLHSLSFTLSSTPVFAMGTVPGNTQYVNINNNTYPLAYGAGLQESDNPINEGNADTITSYFYLAMTSTWSSSFACPNPLPAITVPSTALTQFQQSRTVSFCYTFTGGPGYYTDQSSNGQTWVVSTVGTITTTNYAGTTVNGRTAYLVTGMTGTRTYTDNFNNTFASTITGVAAVNSQSAQDQSLVTGEWLTQVTTNNGYIYLPNDVSNNVMYTSYPYFDSYGVNIQFQYAVADQYQYNLSSSIVRVFNYVQQSADPTDADLGEVTHTTQIQQPRRCRLLLAPVVHAPICPLLSSATVFALSAV